MRAAQAAGNAFEGRPAGAGRRVGGGHFIGWPPARRPLRKRFGRCC